MKLRTMCIFTSSLLGILVFGITMPNLIFDQADGVRVDTIEVHRKRFDIPTEDTIQRYLLIDVTNGDRNGDGVQDFEPLEPVAILLLLPGGEGRLSLNANQREHGGPSFPVHSRYHFAAEGFIVAVMDAASDFLDHNHDSIEDPPGSGFTHRDGLTGHRLFNRVHGDKHKQDLEVVINDLRARYPFLPLWVLGTSRGTESAVVAATELSNPPDGIVLTASLTGPNSHGDLSPGNVDLGRVTVPTLIVTNLDDQCPGTKPEDSIRLKKRFTASPKVQVLIFNGGRTPLNEPCGALSGHTFFGIEESVVDAITKWIKHAERKMKKHHFDHFRSRRN
jgi:hypothetical protein